MVYMENKSKIKVIQITHTPPLSSEIIRLWNYAYDQIL